MHGKRVAGTGVGRVRLVGGWLAWVAVLLGPVRSGAALGRGALAPPALTDPGSWGAWAAARSPLEAGFALLGLVVVALAWYLLAVTSLTAAARLWGAGRLLSVVDVLTLPAVRRGVHAALGLGLVGTTVAGPAAAAGAAGPVPAAMSTAAGAGGARVAEPGTPPGPEPSGRAEGAVEEEPPVMRLLPEAAPAEPERPPEGGAPAPATPASDAAPGEWQVRPGDHLWSVAVRVLADAGAGASADGAVARYWRQLIEANTERLADPANPDLIFPGQVLAVPVPPAAGGPALP